MLMSSDFWVNVKKRCESGIRVDCGQFVLDENRADRSCLGTAVTSEARAYTLVLVGMEEQAILYLRNIREHAIAAFESGESYVYRPVDGRNLFGEYMALRVAGLADWALDGNEHAKLNQSAASRLAEAIELQYDGDSRAAEPIEVASLCVLLSQLSDWEGVKDISSRWSSKRRDVKKALWGGVLMSLAEIAEKALGGDLPRDPKSFSLVRLFNDVTNQGKHGVLYDRRMTMNDVVSLARIISEVVLRVNEPWDAIRLIREGIPS